MICRVVEGIEVIDQIATVATSVTEKGKDVPVDPIYLSMEVISMTKAEITEKYGYEYPEATE